MRVHSSDGASTNLICQKIKDRPYSTCYKSNFCMGHPSLKIQVSVRYRPADLSLRHTVLRSSLVVEVGIYLSHSIIHPPCIVIKFCNQVISCQFLKLSFFALIECYGVCICHLNIFFFRKNSNKYHLGLIYFSQ